MRKFLYFAIIFILTVQCKRQPTVEKPPTYSERDSSTALFEPSKTTVNDVNVEGLDAFLEQIYKQNKWTGSVAIVKAGKPVYLRSKGYIAEKSNRKIDAGTRFRIGSISKTLTAAAILQLVDHDELRLEMTLDQFFPEIPNSSNITIHHLLNHTSGIYNITNDSEIDFFKEYSDEEILKKIRGYEPQFSPGEKYEYSNSNYILLTFIAEKFTEKPFSQILRKRVTGPVGMYRTVYEKQIDTTLNETYSFNYNYDLDRWTAAKPWHESLAKGAGMIASTPKDIALFFSHLRNEKLLSKRFLKKMVTLENDYGYGITTFPFNEETIYGHTGEIGSFRSIAGFVENDDISFAVFTSGATMDINEVTIAVLRAAYNLDMQLLDEAQPKNISKYPGYFESDSIDLDIQVTKDNGKLFAQATGQEKFLLTYIGDDTFEFKISGIKIIFDDETPSKTFELQQAGESFIFKRKE